MVSEWSSPHKHRSHKLTPTKSSSYKAENQIWILQLAKKSSPLGVKSKLTLTRRDLHTYNIQMSGTKLNIINPTKSISLQKHLSKPIFPCVHYCMCGLIMQKRNVRSCSARTGEKRWNGKCSTDLAFWQTQKNFTLYLKTGQMSQRGSLSYL